MKWLLWHQVWELLSAMNIDRAHSTSSPIRRSFLCSWVGLALLASILGCTPSPEEQARRQAHAEALQETHCLDHICQGDHLPAYDSNTEQVFKSGGRWFVGPKAYGSFNGSFAFFWPSKAAARKAGVEGEAIEFVPSSPGKISNFYDVAIQFWIQAKEQQGELHELLAKEHADGMIARRDIPREGLERIERRQGLQRDIRREAVLYVATDLKTPGGVPATVSCRHDNPDGGACTAGFAWRPGYRIYVRFSEEHALDWPEIFAEIIRVLGMVREA